MSYYKYTFLVLGLSTMVFLGCDSQKKTDPQSSTENPDPWTLVFEEEFDNLNAWNIWEGGAFNNEIQYYTSDQLTLDSGILKIRALRKAVTGPTLPHDDTPKSFEYISGRIETKERYGPGNQEGESAYRIMARIKLPAGHGMWPAFWSYETPGPTQGEIDILEARGSEKEVFSSNIFYGTTPGINVNKETEVKHEMGKDLTAEFYIYELIWQEESLQILFDNQVIHTYEANSNNNIKNLFGTEQKIVLNTAVGGWYFQDTNSGNFADSSIMEVDWVRIYKK